MLYSSLDLCGIYAIVSLIDNKVYIGSAKNFRIRFRRHLKDLQKNKHSSILLQRAYNKYGEENYYFQIIKIVKEYNKDIKLTEQHYIDIFMSRDPNKGYNLADASFGDILSSHPNRLEIIKKIKDTSIKNNQAMTSEERKIKYGKSGDKNGRWDPDSWNFCKICGKRIQKLYTHCMEHRDYNKENNPFYGKTHSEETKIKISQNNKGRIPPNAESCIIDDINYDTTTIAATTLNIKQATILHRLKSSNKKFINYRYAYETIDDRIKRSTAIKTRGNNKVIIDNKIYVSVKKASVELNINYTTLNKRLNNKNFPNYSWVQ